MSNVIAKLRDRAPSFHGTVDDPKNWKSQWEILEYLAVEMKPGMRSLETGCGYSTVVFAASGASHTTVTPSTDEPSRVRAFCDEIEVDHSRVTFDIGPSCDVLPKGGDALDLVYIDGAHGFPHPCIDWMYTERRLKVGGILLVDDIRIPSVRILHDFLRKENNWTLDRYIGDTSIHVKMADSPDNAQWLLQGYNRGYPDFSFLPAWKRAEIGARGIAAAGARKLRLAEPIRRLLGRA